MCESAKKKKINQFADALRDKSRQDVSFKRLQCQLQNGNFPQVDRSSQLLAELKGRTHASREVHHTRARCGVCINICAYVNIFQRELTFRHASSTLYRHFCGPSNYFLIIVYILEQNCMELKANTYAPPLKVDRQFGRGCICISVLKYS